VASLPEIHRLADLIGINDDVSVLVENAERSSNPEVRESAYHMLLLMAAEAGINLATPPIFGVPQNLPSEGKVIGHVLRGDNPVGVYRLPISALPGNVGFYGATKSGKSTLVFYLADFWIENNQSVVCLDFSDEYCPLIRRYPADKLSLLKARTTPINPFENPVGSRLDPLAWASRIIGVFREVFFWRDGACNLALDVLANMYRVRGVLEGSRDYPLPSDVLAEVKSRRYGKDKRTGGYAETIQNRLTGLIISFPGMSARKSLVPEQVLQRSLIIRMADLSPGDIDAFTSVFLAWLTAPLGG